MPFDDLRQALADHQAGRLVEAQREAFMKGILRRGVCAGCSELCVLLRSLTRLCSLGHMFEQRLSFDQVARIESFGEQADSRFQELARLLSREVTSTTCASWGPV